MTHFIKFLGKNGKKNSTEDWSETSLFFIFVDTLYVCLAINSPPKSTVTENRTKIPGREEGRG
jgi:hypothetical protein